MEEDATLDGQVLPKRRAAREAGEAVRKAAMDTSSSESEGDSDAGGSGGRGRKRGQGRPKGRASATSRTGKVGRPPTSTAATSSKTPPATTESSVAVHVPTTPGSGRPRKKRAIEVSTTMAPVNPLDGEESDLTPLSSPVDASPPKPKPVVIRAHPMFATTANGSGLLSDGEGQSSVSKRIAAVAASMSSTTTAPPASTSNASASAARRKRSATTGSKGKQKRSDSAWSLESLGKHVWVLLNGKNAFRDGVFDPSSPDDTDSSTERLWWPATVLNDDPTSLPLRIELFLWKKTPVEIQHPSAENILPCFVSRSKLRFERYTDALQQASSSAGPSSQSPSPSKKPKSSGSMKVDDSPGLWETAVDDLKEALEKQGAVGTKPKSGVKKGKHNAVVGEVDLADTDEDLPSLDTILSQPTLSAPSTTVLGRSRSMSNLKGKGKEKEIGKAKSKPGRKRKYQSENEEEAEDDGKDQWYSVKDMLDDLVTPPMNDGNIKIPGELVLARTNQVSLKEYWPAQVLAYIPPKVRGNVKEERRYKVKFLDNIQMDIPRSYFFTEEEDGFGLCKMGKVESTTKDTYDDDENEDHLKEVLESARRSQSPSPASKLPNPERFMRLPIRHQFAYTKPVLQAILNDEYEPVRSKREMFMKGGSGRMNVTKGSTARGMMDPMVVEELNVYVTYWCLREEMVMRDRGVVGREEVEKADMEVEEAKAEAEAETEATERAKEEGGEKESTAMEVEATEKESKVEENGTQGVDVPMEVEVEKEAPRGGIAQSDAGGSPVPSIRVSPVPTELVSSPPMEPPSSSFSLLSQPSSASLEENEGGDAMTTDTTVPPASTAPPTEVTGPSQDSTPTPTSAPRQTGSPDYEALSTDDKLSFCIDILLPEAIRQILLYWEGFRTTPQLLSPQEEQDLYEKGAELLEKTDWVLAVLNKRKRKEQSLQKKMTKGLTDDLEVSKSRSGRVVRKVTYREDDD
ncbi:hypothetical protein CC1G_01030 [Coprinopsis cinerea okayama7|uniref:Uncharacterized protein n=1 Tax=Coprinopsis cinerea (strain Okayama-7 / 130 / ATCC MYA-4618 / FGSC 9003) TaxID=240176 RepID=A8NEA0_COPC7|nr:hypothetical protein CC1G_01030 [Coprinopsis cinerea okayama7\|eukprot:XP_001832968.1 hypothetical protein CC1G_01030 [Coprinopsis cinerea okayama7\